jgi:CAAX prenyl protease-like protein
MFLQKRMAESPIFARVAPFVIFLVLTSGQGFFGEASRYWVYLAKTLVGVWLIWEMRSFVTEMRWAFSWEAVVVGIGVCVIWVGLDDFYPKMGKPGEPWNPHTQFGAGSALAWFYVAVRILGSTFVVPPLEETFYRSFVYRYIIKFDFTSVALGRFDGIAFVLTSAIFGFLHYQWFAGILCGMAYQGLTIYKGRLGDAMTAHAITNFLLGVWIVWKGGTAWLFW